MLIAIRIIHRCVGWSRLYQAQKCYVLKIYISITHGEIDAVIAFHTLTKEFEGVKENEELTKFIIAGHQDGWISIEDEKANESNELGKTISGTGIC